MTCALLSFFLLIDTALCQYKLRKVTPTSPYENYVLYGGVAIILIMLTAIAVVTIMFDDGERKKKQD